MVIADKGKSLRNAMYSLAYQTVRLFQSDGRNRRHIQKDIALSS